MPWSFGARWRTIARNSSRATVLGSWSGPELVDDPKLLIGDEQEQPEQLRLDRRDRAQDVVDRQRVGRRQDGVGGDPRVASRPSPRRPALIGLRPGPLEDLAQDAVLDARCEADLAERLVAAERVGDLADRRHHGLDEADPARARLEVEPVARDGR